MPRFRTQALESDYLALNPGSITYQLGHFGNLPNPSVGSALHLYNGDISNFFIRSRIGWAVQVSIYLQQCLVHRGGLGKVSQAVEIFSPHSIAHVS